MTTFEEELSETIRKGREEKAEDADQKFKSDWDNLRRGPILTLLTRAAKVIQAEARMGVSLARIDNGGVMLGAAGDGSPESIRFQHELKFRPNHADRKVVCSSSVEGEPDEPFDLVNLTEPEVVAKVKAFVLAVVRGSRPKKVASAIF